MTATHPSFGQQRPGQSGIERVGGVDEGLDPHDVVLDGPLAVSVLRAQATAQRAVAVDDRNRRKFARA